MNRVPVHTCLRKANEFENPSVLLFFPYCSRTNAFSPQLFFLDECCQKKKKR